MFSHECHKRVRYSETDKMGFLYYGNYPAYYEVARVEMLRSLGLSYQKMEDEMGILLPVVSLEIRYLRPAYYDDSLKMITYLDEMPSKLIQFRHEIFSPNDELINKASIKLFFTQIEDNNRVSCPGVLTEALKPYFETT